MSSTDGAAHGRRPATGSERRRQALIDALCSLVLAILAWPFPLARASLGVTVHVVAILVFWQLVQVAYYVLTTLTWHRTGGFVLLGLELRTANGGEAARGDLARWALVAGSTAAVRVLGSARTYRSPDSAERASGLRVLSAG
jgi:hypothetical protein